MTQINPKEDEDFVDASDGSKVKVEDGARFGTYLPPFSTAPMGPEEVLGRVEITKDGKIKLEKPIESEGLDVKGDEDFADEDQPDLAKDLLRMVKVAMPKLTRSSVFSEFAMEAPKDAIHYIQPVLKNE